MAKIILSLVDNYNQLEYNEDNKDNKLEEELHQILEINSKILDDKDNELKLKKYKLKLDFFNYK